MSKLRTQIQLEPSDHVKLKRFADKNRISMAAAVRMLIRQALGDSEPDNDQTWKRFMEAAGCFDEPDGATDVALNHNLYLHGK